MITKLSSFSDQFDPELVAAGKALFENGNVGRLVKDDENWRAEVMDAQKYKVTVHVDEDIVTAIFCPCGPKLCPHVISTFFALQKRLKIKSQPFDPSHLDFKPHELLGARLNDIVYASRAVGSKNGELEAMGEDLVDLEPDVTAFKTMIIKQLTWPNKESMFPILTGAKRLLGAAILNYGEKNYVFVFAVARAILTAIGGAKGYIAHGDSAGECVSAAIELLNTLCSDPSVPADMRKEVFERVVFACKKDLYDDFHSELLTIFTNPQLHKDLQQLAKQELMNIISTGGDSGYYAKLALYMLLQRPGNEEELRQFKLDNPDIT
jgi:hypothetical protein